MRTSLSATQRVLIGVACVSLFAGCGGTSPIGPGSVGGLHSSGIEPRVNPQYRQSAPNTPPALSERAAEGRFLVCILTDNSRTQLSLAVWGMPGAVHHCLTDLNGRVHGIVRSPAPIP